MTKQGFTLMLGMILLLVLASLIGSGPKALAFSPCTNCLKACRQQYQACVASGQIGCDEVYADCTAACPCP